MSSQFDKLGLTKEERLVVDRLITAHVESGACYGRITYKKGFRDCVDLLKSKGVGSFTDNADGTVTHRGLRIRKPPD